MGRMTTCLYLKNTVPNIQYPDHLTLCVCQMAIVLWSNRVETEYIRIIIKASGSKTYIILKYTQNKNQPSIRDIGGIKAHNRQSFLIWKGQKLRLQKFKQTKKFAIR